MDETATSPSHHLPERKTQHQIIALKHLQQPEKCIAHSFEKDQCYLVQAFFPSSFPNPSSSQLYSKRLG